MSTVTNCSTCLQCPCFQSGFSGCARSQSGRRLRIGGNRSKLSGGGGEVVAHSSVHAFHGLFPAGSPCKKLMTMFHKKTATASPMTTAPIVESDSDAPSRKIWIRKYSARHAHQTKEMLHRKRHVETDQHQPEMHFPKSLESIRPLIFGNQ